MSQDEFIAFMSNSWGIEAAITYQLPNGHVEWQLAFLDGTATYFCEI